MSDHRPVSILTIAGSDCGAGAGIQADLKTFAAHRVHGLSAIAALTAQNTRGVSAIHAPPAGFLRAQIDACFDDFRIGAVKLGMLATADLIDTVADALEHHRPPHVVVDPVMVATSGAKLLRDDALAALRTRLLPLAWVLTPNLPEAEILLGHPLHGEAEMPQAAQELLALGARGVLLKGGHLEQHREQGDSVIDLYLERGRIATGIRHPRLDVVAHGTGCTLAAAVAANLGLGLLPQAACEAASDYTHEALRRGYRPGRSEVLVLDHFGAAPPA